MGKGNAKGKGTAQGKGKASGTKRKGQPQSRTQQGGGGGQVFEAEVEEGDFTDTRRYHGTDVYEYEMPEDFEDEEIDSDEAFNADDRAK